MNQDRYHRAARDGFLEILYDASKRDANQSDDDGLTPTLMAAFCGHLDALRILVGRGGDPEKTTLLGSSALHLAASKGYLNCVSFLVNFGINMWCLDNDLRTPKDIAAINKKKEILDYLDDTMAKQSAWNTKAVQKCKEKAMIAAEKRIKLFRKLQMKSIKQAEKEERHMHRRKLFSAHSTSDINLIDTSVKHNTRDLYQFSDQFGDNLYLKSAKSLHDQVVTNSKGSKRYKNTSLTSRDRNSNIMKFSDIVNDKKMPIDRAATSTSICSESTITSKIRSIGGVSRKVHLKKLMQSISSIDNQKMMPSNQIKSLQAQVDEGDQSLNSLDGCRNNDHISHVSRFDTQSLNVNIKRQSITSKFQQMLPNKDDAGIEDNSFHDNKIEDNQQIVSHRLSSPISNDFNDDTLDQTEVSIGRDQPIINRIEKSLIRAISVPDFTSEINKDKMQQTHKYGEYIINPSKDDGDKIDLNPINVQKSIENRSNYLKEYCSIKTEHISKTESRDEQIELTKSRMLQQRIHDIQDRRTPLISISIEKQTGNFNTLDDSIGSASSLAQRNTVSTTSSSSNTKSSSSSMTSDNTFESISVQTNESSTIFDNLYQLETSMFSNKNDHLMRKKEEFSAKEGIQISSTALNPKYQWRNDGRFKQDPIDTFLMTNGLIDLSEVFHKEKIDLEALMLLTEDDLKSLEILLGPRRKLLKAIHDRSIQLHDPHIMIDTPL